MKNLHTNEHSSNGISFRNGISFPAPGLKYHGIRADGVYVPICFIDPHGEPGEAEAVLVLCREESSRLRAEGRTVEEC